MFVHKNHAAGGENGSIMVGMFVFLCLASQQPSEREFFIPARTDLGVKLLRNNNKTCHYFLSIITLLLATTLPYNDKN